MKENEGHIILDDVSYKYPEGKEYVLKKINLVIPKGQFVVLMGANGAGKTTFCELLNGIIPKSLHGTLRGNVTVAGLNTRDYKVSQLSEKVGLVLQDPETQLFTGSVRSEIAFGPENISVPKEVIRERLKWALEVVRLEGYSDREPTNLSGGQKQRLAVASVISMRPEILVLDEPTSQLDPIGRFEVFSVVKELNKKHGMTIVMASHQSEEIAEFADRIIVIDKGKIIADDVPSRVFAQDDLLKRAWVRIPQVSALANYLKKKNITLSQFPVTIGEMAKNLDELFNEI